MIDRDRLSSLPLYVLSGDLTCGSTMVNSIPNPYEEAGVYLITTFHNSPKLKKNKFTRKVFCKIYYS